MLIRNYLDDGLSKAEVARKLGVSRDTVHRLIRTGQMDRDLDEKPVRYKPRPPVPVKLDTYKPIIVARLEAYPELSAVRLFDEIRAAGYAGGYTQVKEFVRKVRPCIPKAPVVRFETPPGLQAQVDFARFRFPWGVRYALLVVLGYSRLLWLRFYERQDMRTLFRGLEEAFAVFGGVPKELLFDQMRSVITKDLRMLGGQLVVNEEFLRFASHWGFRPRACQPYRPETKGKVERPIRYVRGNFVYGREFVGDAHLDAERERWLAGTANVRIHGTTKERPVERFESERHLLLPLAERSYRSLVLVTPQPPIVVSAPASERVEVQRRSLAAYDELAGAA
jgi:transposase